MYNIFSIFFFEKNRHDEQIFKAGKFKYDSIGKGLGEKDFSRNLKKLRIFRTLSRQMPYFKRGKTGKAPRKYRKGPDTGSGLLPVSGPLYVASQKERYRCSI